MLSLLLLVCQTFKANAKVKKIEMKQRSIFTLLLISFIAIFLLLVNCSGQKSMIDKTVVEELEIKKYLGTWYELARYDHSFERNLVGVSAKYSMREDGMIKVVNSGYKKTLDGKYSEQGVLNQMLVQYCEANLQFFGDCSKIQNLAEKDLSKHSPKCT